ncbi:MAG TPA: sigma-70 family RNA polymerase sigma factor [Spirochaetia bacterium]|nr:sigma-70 family RNA polymerase sigma factor [Spirochaetia bacterium]
MPVRLLSLEKSAAESPTDEDLIRRYVEAGEQRAFVTLISRHLPRMRRMLFGLLNGNRDDMQDVEQEILIALCGRLDRFRFDSAFETFLYRFARNKAIDHIRRQARQRRIVEAVGEAFSTSETGDDEWLVEIHGRDSVASILSRLSEEERLLITLKELEGLDIREIAKIMGVAVGTIKSRLHRTRGKIARLAKGEMP